MLEFLRTTISAMVAIRSLTGQETALADYIEARLRGLGLAAQRDDQDNLWVDVGPDGDAAQRLHVNAHMDTVTPGPGWETDPFTPVCKGDRLVGLGTSDCKSGLAAMLWLAPRVRPKVPVRFSFTVSEEGHVPHRENGSRRMAAAGGRWAITCEPSCSVDGPGISLGTQGHAKATVRFAGTAAHSSRPDLGDNAILAAARFCADLAALQAGYPEQRFHGDAVARAAVAPTMIEGGRLVNVIPDACEVRVSRRLAPGESAATFDAELRRLLEGTRATHEIQCDGPCAMVDLDGALFAAAREAVSAVAGRERCLFQRGRTDAVIFAGAGMDTITIGPGQAGRSHTANEYVVLPVAADCVRVLERVINALS